MKNVIAFAGVFFELVWRVFDHYGCVVHSW